MNMEKSLNYQIISIKGTRLGQLMLVIKASKSRTFWIVFELSQGLEKDIESVPRYSLKELHIKTPDKDSRKTTHLIKKIWNSKLKGTHQIKICNALHFIIQLL